jgi:hypothetical protein
VKVRVRRNGPYLARPWSVLRRERCHDYCFRWLGDFQTWEQAIRYAVAVAYGD